jgi:hypothetical protein
MTRLAQREQLVLDAINRNGGGVTLPELAYQTGLHGHQLHIALDRLQDYGHIAPYSWTTETIAAGMNRMAERSAQRSKLTRPTPRPPVEPAPSPPVSAPAPEPSRARPGHGHPGGSTATGKRRQSNPDPHMR